MKLYCREVMFSQALKNMFSGYYNVSKFNTNNNLSTSMDFVTNPHFMFPKRIFSVCETLHMIHFVFINFHLLNPVGIGWFYQR